MKLKNTKFPTTLSSTLLHVDRAQGRIYCLIELKIFENAVYCISISADGEFSAELVGDDPVEARRLFDLLCDECVPSYQLFDVVSDRKRDSLTKNS